MFELQGYDFNRRETWPAWFTQDPPTFGPGDIIDRDPETGLPTGVFYGAAAPALIDAPPERTFEQNVEKPGKLADLVVIDADLLKASAEDLLTMGDGVVLTMVGGKVEFRREGFELTRASR